MKRTLPEQTVRMKWVPKHKRYYEGKGYIFTKFYEEFDVDIKDLSFNSNIKIEYICDYCGELSKTAYAMYNRLKDESSIKKDCCRKCAPLKIKESNLTVYGVDSTNKVKEIRDKQKQTNIERYGCENPLGNREIQEKAKKTSIERYGFDNAMKNDNIKNKAKSTWIIKYGCKSPTLNNEVREKQISTMRNRYGVCFPMQNLESRSKAIRTMYMKGNAPSSRQQKYVCNILNGELNYPIAYCSLDIAFPDEKIYIECDFSGHWLSVKFGNMTEQEFKDREKRRYYFLKRLGWKEIRIKSKQDKIPDEDKILCMLKFSKEYLKEHSWINFDIDRGKVYGSCIDQEFDYGRLSHIA